MRFVVDVHLPRPLIHVFRRYGHLADYATDHLPAVATDKEIWTFAAAFDAAIVTKDEDFIDLVARRPERVPVLWLRCGNIYNPDLYALVERHLPAIVTAFAADEQIVELR